MSRKGPFVVQILPDPVQYNPNKQKDRETAKRIRSHIADNLRRKKLQVLYNPTPSAGTQNPGEDPPSSAARNFCNCIVLPSSAPIKDGKSKALQKQHAIADSYKICQRCHKVQFLELSWAGQLKAARQRAPSVSRFLESEFDPFQTLPELAAYKESPQSKRLMNEFKAHMITYWPYEPLRNVILPMAAGDAALFMGLLYSSCCHLEAIRGGGETALSIAIKAEAMRQINLRLDDPKKRHTSVTIACIGYLSSGVFANAPSSVIQETEAHENGMTVIYSQGLGGIVSEDDACGQALLYCFIAHKMSRAATLAQPIPPQFIFAFCQNTRTFSPDEFLPESPVYCPRDDFYTLKKSAKCSACTLQLVRGLKGLIDSLIEDNPNVTTAFDYDAFRTSTLALPSASSRTAPPKVRGDYIYESLRVVASMLLHCIDTRTSFAQMPSALVAALQRALQRTDIGACWGTMSSGLFFFVAMIASASSIGRPQHGFMASIMARGDHEIAYGNPVFEGAAVAAWRVQRLHLELIRVWEEGGSAVLQPLGGSSPLGSDVSMSSVERSSS